ncbi:MAG TPA: RNA-binding S4 domain-containing protein [Gemmatimonadales bacterium]|nr:RNA-binding S4 domain-containing protein [Gemmatimonadales bacterium]
MANRRRNDPAEEPESEDRVRLDQWLWAARFFKTRALAADGVAGGKVELNGARPKRAHQVRAGDRLRLRLGHYEFTLRVRALSARRGPASAAQQLYEEDAESVARRAELATRLKAEATAFSHFEGRPTKKERRAIQKIRGKS